MELEPLQNSSYLANYEWILPSAVGKNQSGLWVNRLKRYK